MNVLEVMDTDGRAVALTADSCVGLRRKQWQAHLAVHDEARASVAELMAKVERLERKAIVKGKLTASVFISDVEAVRAALARCKGGAA